VITIDECVTRELRRGPAPLRDIVLVLRFAATERNVVRALRRLKYAGIARCNVDRPVTAWHLTGGKCPCKSAACERERKRAILDGARGGGG